jgi:hypothetical protein
MTESPAVREMRIRDLVAALDEAAVILREGEPVSGDELALILGDAADFLAEFLACNQRGGFSRQPTEPEK